MSAVNLTKRLLKALLDSLAAIPVPLIDLGVLEAQASGKLSHLFLGPKGIFIKLLV